MTRSDRWRRQAGNAMVELVVLLPVYLLLVIGLFHLGNLSLVKQQAIEAARFAAWAGDSPARSAASDPKGAYFGRFSGTASVTANAPAPRRFDESDIEQALSDERVSGSNDPEAIETAARVLNNEGAEPWLRTSRATASFTYSAPDFTDFGGAYQASTPEASHTVLLRNRSSERPVFEEGSRRHPIEDLIGDTFGGFRSRHDAWETDFNDDYRE